MLAIFMAQSTTARGIFQQGNSHFASHDGLILGRPFRKTVVTVKIRVRMAARNCFESPVCRIISARFIGTNFAVRSSEVAASI